MEPENPPAPPSARFEQCLPCPCNGGSCRLLTSTQKHLGRQYYKCPRQQLKCEFFKWADLVEPHELINVPYCGGCMAGVCRFTKVTSGPNAGRILFMCRVKEGQGSCGFQVWQDELHENATPFVGCDNTGPVTADMVMDFNLISDEEPDNESHLNDTSINKNSPCPDVTTFGKMEQWNCQEEISDDVLRTSSKESTAGDQKSFSTLLHPISESNEEFSVNEAYSPSQFTPECNSELSCSRTTQVAVNAPSRAELFSETTPNNVMTEAISKSFTLAAEHLQNDLITRLEVMDFKDHEAMTHASEATFAALNRLFHDYQPMKERVNELIHSAVSLAEIEKSIPDEDSYQCLMDHSHRERIKLGEIDKAHAKVVSSVDKKGKRLIALQEELSSMKEWISRAEAEIMCCKAEMRNMENQLVEISNNKKQILKENFLIASKEWEDRLKLRERKDVEKSAAKAAFDRARALLRR
ncbi:uncharacterized protein LOC142555632 [Primulina tabacum]|uniref:uncharacterized protein LOC142555632 n=1 Tax=Primulina tabacum TaxID=48773 RepID=UPI003F591577